MTIAMASEINECIGLIISAAVGRGTGALETGAGQQRSKHVRPAHSSMALPCQADNEYKATYNGRKA